MKPFLALLLAMTLLHTARAQNKTVEDRLAEYGDIAGERLRPYFKKAGVPYPPSSLTLIGLKEEKVLQVYAAGSSGKQHFIREYKIFAASGNAGPKLCQGDLQVPEGFYKIELLNPNSLFHLSLRINYPNEFDRTRASVEGRSDLGGDIMIHGNAVSIGCLAMGDEAAEDLFVLAAKTGLPNIKVILAPMDFRVHQIPALQPGSPPWLGELYVKLKKELRKYKSPPVPIAQ